MNFAATIPNLYVDGYEFVQLAPHFVTFISWEQLLSMYWVCLPNLNYDQKQLNNEFDVCKCSNNDGGMKPKK